jgi:hypothetical protein
MVCLGRKLYFRIVSTFFPFSYTIYTMDCESAEKKTILTDECANTLAHGGKSYLDQLAEAAEDVVSNCNKNKRLLVQPTFCVSPL